MNTPYTFHADPGHGWLAVPISEIVTLGIAGQISPYSYMKGDMAYLEEDCDYSLFFEAKLAKGEKPETVTEHTDYESPIRNYPRFSVRGHALSNNRELF
jgi:hypothetical protein